MICCLKRESEFTQILDLGCFGHCDVMQFANAPKDSTYYLSYDTSCGVNEIELGTYLKDEPFTIDMSCFNENIEVIFRIYDTDNNVVEFDGNYQKLRLKTKIKRSIKKIDNEITNECGKVL